MIYWFVLFATIILFPAIARRRRLARPFRPFSYRSSRRKRSHHPARKAAAVQPATARRRVGQTLADHGVYIIARNLSDAIATVSGGVKQGVSLQGSPNWGSISTCNTSPGSRAAPFTSCLTICKASPSTPSTAAHTSTTACSRATVPRSA